jgi:hypothetical protein
MINKGSYSILNLSYIYNITIFNKAMVINIIKRRILHKELNHLPPKNLPPKLMT